MHEFNINNNLTIHNQPQFDGWDVVPGYKLVTQYLQSIDSVLSKALSEYPRTLVVRFDLHFPTIPNCPDYPSEFDSTAITRFFESFKAQVNADLAKKEREGKRIHPCTVRYVWAKERADAAQHHYHVALLLNKDTYFVLGSYQEVCDNLAGKIYRAWGSALMCSPDEILSLVHFPSDTPYYHLDRNAPNFDNQYNEVFRRLSYLAKIETKVYGYGGKNFSCSRK